MVDPSTSTTTEVVASTVPASDTWTRADIDGLTYIVGGGLLLCVMLLVAIFVRSG